MAKTATVTQTKAATKAANTKSQRVKASENPDKPKREPSAYQVFCKEHMKKWNEANPGRAKEAMSQIALMWKDAPENPNRGKEPKARKPKEPKEPKAPKAKAERPKKTKKTSEIVEDDTSDPAQEDSDDDE